MRNVVRCGVGTILVLGLACQQQVERVGGVQSSGDRPQETTYHMYRFVGQGVSAAEKNFVAVIKIEVYHYPPAEYIEILRECAGYSDCYIEEMEEDMGKLHAKDLTADTPVEKTSLVYQFMMGISADFGDNEYDTPYDNRWEGELAVGAGAAPCCNRMRFFAGSRYYGDRSPPSYEGELLKTMTAAEWRELTGEDS